MAVHLAGLCVQDLLHHLVGDVGTVALGLVCHVDLHVGDGIGAEGHGHGDRGGGVDAGGGSAVGTGGGAGSHAAGSSLVAAGGQQTGSSSAQGAQTCSVQEVAAGDLVAHNSSLLLVFFSFFFRWQSPVCTKRRALSISSQSIEFRATRRSTVILTKKSQDIGQSAQV